MSKRRKLLFALLVPLLAIDGIYLFVKTRPVKPMMTFEFTGSGTSALWDDIASVKNAIFLGSNGRWTLRNGEEVDPIDAVDLTIPNTDSPDYWAKVNSLHPITFGYAIKAAQSLAKLGVCNFVFLANSNSNRTSLSEAPVLELDYYSDADEKQSQKCRTSKVIADRCELATARYKRTGEFPQALDW